MKKSQNEIRSDISQANGDHEDAITNAYVTPIPETTKEGGDERDWERVRGAVLSVYAA